MRAVTALTSVSGMMMTTGSWVGTLAIVSLARGLKSCSSLLERVTAPELVTTRTLASSPARASSHAAHRPACDTASSVTFITKSFAVSFIKNLKFCNQLTETHLEYYNLLLYYVN